MRVSLFCSETSLVQKAKMVSRKGQRMRIGLSAGMYRQISQTALWGLPPACGRQVHGLVLSDKVKGTTAICRVSLLLWWE